MTRKLLMVFIVVVLSRIAITRAAAGRITRQYTNSIGMKLVRVEPGTFLMGAGSTPLSDRLISLYRSPSDRVSPRLRLRQGDYDESPRHKVTITMPFYMSETEVTVEQFRQFRPAFPGFKARLDHHPYVSGVSWYDAVAFCEWLSEKESTPYRLPTEAEWEYCCRAGTETPFSSGQAPPEHETPNQWSIKNMHTGVLEWCLDWHGLYPDGPQTDPIGPEKGWVKVVRGGGLDWLDAAAMSYYFGRDYEPWAFGTSPFYVRSANRAAVPPNFAPPPREYQAAQMSGINPPLPPGPQSHSPYRAKGLVAGYHYIGFRVVQGPMPRSKALTFEPPFLHCCVKQTRAMVSTGPDLDRPYYRTRRIFPQLTAEQMVNVGWKIGLPPGLGTNYHNGALVALSNGDILASYYNGFSESDPDLSIMGVRLRYGCDQWDIPSVWPDFLDGNDASPFIWNDNGTLWLGWGCPHLTGGYPFQWTISEDNGATWAPVKFPVFESHPGGYGRRQPINCAFRAPDGTVYIAFDGWGPTSGLWASRNNAKTWFDAGGRTLGLHATFVLLDDGRILSFGTRNRSIDGFCPRNISTDRGKTWQLSRSPVPGQGGGQNPVMLKLASGRLLYVSDFGRAGDPRVKGFVGGGPYVGLSDDDGETWQIRKLVGGHVHDENGNSVQVRTVGYVGAAQSPNGIIHLVTSHNNPNLHFELNEAWILADDAAAEAAVMKSHRTTKMIPASIKTYHENYPSGKPKSTYVAGLGEDGRYMLDGRETWYYEDGRKQWEVTYRRSRRVGTETYWSTNGSIRWKWDYNQDGTKNWTVYKSDGDIKARSHWRGDKLLSYELGD